MPSKLEVTVSIAGRGFALVCANFMLPPGLNCYAWLGGLGADLAVASWRLDAVTTRTETCAHSAAIARYSREAAWLSDLRSGSLAHPDADVQFRSACMTGM